MLITLGVLLFISVSLLLIGIKIYKRKVDLHLGEIDQLNAKRSFDKNILKKQSKIIMDTLETKTVYETALKNISKNQYIQFGLPPAPRATFVPPYQIAEEALEQSGKA